MMTKQRNYGEQGNDRRRPPANETVLHSDKLQIERKSFLFTVKENPRGRFLRITEDVGGRRDSIIIPSTGLNEFLKTLDAVAKACPSEVPPPDHDKPLEA